MIEFTKNQIEKKYSTSNGFHFDSKVSFINYQINLNL